MENQSFRLLIFFSTFLSLALLEVFFSYRRRNLLRKDRWPGNMGLIVISNILIAALLPISLTAIAFYAQTNSWGLLHQLSWSKPLALVASIVLLDGAIYFQHILSHKIPILWRFHRVHHADTDLDVTSALRFHPVEILCSIGYKVLLICTLGVSPEAMVIFEVLLSSMAMFNHSNLYIPHSLEKYLRWIVVTPQMHIVHHSVERNESEKNYGFNLSIWDRTFKTYQARFISKGQIGQNDFRDKKEHGLIKILQLPFLKETNGSMEQNL